MAVEKTRIGSIEVAVARDGYWEAAPSTHLRDLKNEAIPNDRIRDALDGRDPDEVIRSRVISFVVKSEGKTILLDAGVGAWGFWRFGDGHLLDSLAALDVKPEEVDYVIPSHLHLDHIGWNTHPGPDGEPVITFPNARHLFHQADWDHFTSPEFLQRESATPHEYVPYVDTCLMPIRDAGLMDLVSSEAEVTKGVTILHTPGHTDGSVSILVQSGGEAAIFIGDLAHLCVQLDAARVVAALRDGPRGVRALPHSRRRGGPWAQRPDHGLASGRGADLRAYGAGERPPYLDRRRPVGTRRALSDAGGSHRVSLRATARTGCRDASLDPSARAPEVRMACRAVEARIP